MSSTLPPPPPSGPPSGPPNGPTGGPPGGPPSGPPAGPPPSGPPEFLESGGGGPLPPRQSRGSGLKRGLLLGGGVVGLAAAGVGAWAAYGFLSTGAQPSEALPADTLGYLSVDLDPSGGQKIEALRTLNKFPAFEDEVGIDTDDDLRKALFDEIQGEAQCEGLDYEDDIEPWLGDRAAVAAVDLGGEDPDPVVVVQVSDTDAADAGLKAIMGCGEGGEAGWAFTGDWVVVAETDAIAEDVVSATEDGSLADDEGFRQWTGEAGDAGVVTAYAGAAAGDYFADHAEELGFSFGGTVEDYACGMSQGFGLDETPAPGTDDVPLPCDPATTPGGGEVADEALQELRDFQGMAMTVRFDDGAVELETAGDANIGVPGVLGAGATADVVQSLPADTGAVFGIGFADGWFGDVVDYIAPYVGSESEELMADLSEMSGLDLPEDAETLAGDSVALALGSDFDPETMFNSEDGSDIPVGVKIKGDPDEIESVLDKLRETAGAGASVLEADSEGDTIVLGPNPDYRSELLGDGGLGDSEVFQDVVREADDAHTVLFVNVNEFEDALRSAAGEDGAEVVENIEPISGIGMTGWIEDDVVHAVLRLATD